MGCAHESATWDTLGSHFSCIKTAHEFLEGRVLCSGSVDFLYRKFGAYRPGGMVGGSRTWICTGPGLERFPEQYGTDPLRHLFLMLPLEVGGKEFPELPAHGHTRGAADKLPRALAQDEGFVSRSHCPRLQVEGNPPLGLPYRGDPSSTALLAGSEYGQEQREGRGHLPSTSSVTQMRQQKGANSAGTLAVGDCGRYVVSFQPHQAGEPPEG